MFKVIVCLSMVFVTIVSGNMFNPFSSFSGFGSFPSFPNPFGSPFGSGFPFGQSFGGSRFSSDDPFSSSSPFPFQPPTPSSFPSSFNRGFSSSSFPFPHFPSFPSFTDFTNGMANGELEGNGIKVTSTSSNSKTSPGQVIQTIKVEKIGSENGPGEERRIVQTFRASGPLVTPTGLNSQGSKGNNRTNKPNQRPNVPRPIRLNTNNQQNQQRKPPQSPQRPLRPTTTLIAPQNGLTVNGTQSTSVHQSNLLNNSMGKPSGTTNQLALSSSISGSAPKVSSSSSSTGTSISTNKSSTSQSNFNSQNSKINGPVGSLTSFNSLNSEQSASKTGSGVTVRRVDSSGRIINGF